MINTGIYSRPGRLRTKRGGSITTRHFGLSIWRAPRFEAEADLSNLQLRIAPNDPLLVEPGVPIVAQMPRHLRQRRDSAVQVQDRRRLGKLAFNSVKDRKAQIFDRLKQRQICVAELAGDQVA